MKLAAAGNAVDEALAIDEAKTVLKANLRDPYSAKITDVTYKISPNFEGELIPIVCGYVNAKNGFGGYIGVRQFVYFIQTKKISIADPDSYDQVTPALNARLCQ